MYFPYLRGKQFELEALLGVAGSVYRNTLPIVEPVNKSSGKYYLRLSQQNIPFVLIMNPQLPLSGRLPIDVVQTSIVDSTLLNHTSLTLGLIIDQYSTTSELQAFLNSNPTKDKAIIFRHNPTPAVLSGIDTVLKSSPPRYLIFDDRKTSNRTRSSLQWHSFRVLLTDGFQRQNANKDYPLMSAYDSNYSSWVADGWAGIGDYLTIGDHFQDGGGQPYVVTLHLSTVTPVGLEMYHFSSTINATIRGGVPPKFREACALLANSPIVAGLSSTGLRTYQDWYVTAFNPQLGAAKKASIQHHIELLSSIV